MNDFPDWAQKLLTARKDSVFHGLNLALPLENPSRLPLLLWEISAAQPKIRTALDHLSFLHYARFVPSWDGRALMVITEFDGPLEPYVMDFVIAIGDVFDVLLSYVDTRWRPKLPTREFPDEFLEFVRTWNRVPFMERMPFGIPTDLFLLPASFDYPVYGAYRDKTVIDITGPRATLPPPAIDRPAALLDLPDIQGNILRGFNAVRARHLFLEVTDPKKARDWLAKTFTDAASAWGGLSTAEDWGAAGKPETATTVAFTYGGLRTLLPRREADLEKFPVAFVKGALARHCTLAAEDGTGRSVPTDWRFGKDSQRIHVLVSLYQLPGPSATETAFETVAGKLLASALASRGLERVHEQDAHKLGAAKGSGEVYFGYVDGISEPRISGQPVDPKKPDFQPASSPGEFVLGRDYTNIFGGSSLGGLAPDLATHGTFGALQLIEQDVEAFEKSVEGQAHRLGLTDDVVKALLMGRAPDGYPVALAPDPRSRRDRNDFDYARSWERPKLPDDHDGQRCPVGAHIRRVNPRSARVTGASHARRLIRRGMPTTWTEGATEKKGLLGLFLCASLERQFEFIQHEWIQGDQATSGIRGSQDPIAGLRGTTTRLPIEGGRRFIEVPPVVHLRGSLYLFFPSVSLVRGLARKSTTHGFAPQGLAAGSGGGGGQAAAPATSPTAAPTARTLGALAERHEAVQASGEADRWAALLPDDTPGFESLALGDAWREVRALLSELPWNGDWRNPRFFEHFDAFLPKDDSRFAPAGPSADNGFSALDPEFVQDPFNPFARLRKDGRKVIWVPEHRAYWILDRAMALAALKNHTDYVQAPSHVALRGIITLDPPRHTVVRDVVAAAFKTALADVDKEVATAVVKAMDTIGSMPHFDAVRLYTEVVPTAVVMTLLGLDGEDRDDAIAYARATMSYFSQPVRPGSSYGIASADASARLAMTLAWRLVKAVLASHAPLYSSDGTILAGIAEKTTLVGTPDAARPLTRGEALITLVQIVLAHLSAGFLLGTALRNLLMPDPRPGRSGQIPWDTLARLQADATKDPGKQADFDTAIEHALDEARRIDPPVTIIQRFARKAMKVGDFDVAEDCPVHIVVASANRGLPAGVAEPEQFHWDREPADSHLSLGHGLHECVGNALQERIVPAALTALLSEMPTLRLVDADAVPAWLDNVYFRVLCSLPVMRDA
jgi:cytochrome P450/deferrochelatase/peroxidase EfeB